MTIDDYTTTISNKVQGTLNLHQAAIQLGIKLDFFSMLSSISGIVGQKGQANYAAANAFLDAFAAYRIKQGLPGNSIDLGVIEEVGYVAEQGGMMQHFDTGLWNGIGELVLRRILNYSLLQQTDKPINADSACQLITGIAVPVPADADIGRDARFSTLFTSEQASNSGAATDDLGLQAFFLLHKSGAEYDALLNACVEVVNKRFTKMLRLSEPMEPAKPLTTYGLDSLSAVEFRNWLKVELGAELTALEVANAKSLFSLCDKILAKLSASK